MLLQFYTIPQRSTISFANIPEELTSWVCDLCNHTGLTLRKSPGIGLVFCYCFLEVMDNFSTKALCQHYLEALEMPESIRIELGTWELQAIPPTCEPFYFSPTRKSPGPSPSHEDAAPLSWPGLGPSFLVETMCVSSLGNVAQRPSN